MSDHVESDRNSIVPDRPVNLVRELSARFYASEVSKFMVMPILF
ncbi:hypothetical protein SLEP1_g49453 [Rubroshorea leprosula]|uniref:Uncharacterized protein n=1 Tax=Rubroshorea leprosula TaxID=152421 RepID=A0AAV5LWU5_9ROSI|nr:hypothetical protein SLEP1_g49453 [Rubroshorea leprosula]